MKPAIVALMIAAAASSAPAGELFSGSHTYTGTDQTWMLVPGSGYTTLIMVGTYSPMSGPIPESRIECRGANFWTTEISEASGVCVFGEVPDRWMLRYRMTNNEPSVQRAERFNRRGEWTVVGGIGRYEGMTGFGTYLAESGSVDGAYRTMWEGEVTIPE